MKKTPLYSRSRIATGQPPPPAGPSPEPGSPSSAAAAVSQTAMAAPATTSTSKPPSRLRRFGARHERKLWIGAMLLLVLAGLAFNALQKTPALAPLTLKQIDAAMRKSIAEKPLRSPAAAAYEAVLPSLVRVVGMMSEDDDGSDVVEEGKEGKMERGVGSGVVIMDNGTILTNLHVVSGAKRIRVTFHDGLESDATVVNVQPENDLAVLRAKRIPDDLFPATMRSTGDLRPGDEVVAAGFPFGIGPSASAGVVSGLKREFRSPEGQQMLSNLIQFDAAANPGNSGGPLVTMDGQVVGIVTAILNPSRQRVFIGIGFAVPIENAAAAAGMPPF